MKIIRISIILIVILFSNLFWVLTFFSFHLSFLVQLIGINSEQVQVLLGWVINIH